MAGCFQSVSLAGVGVALYYGHYSFSSLVALAGMNVAGLAWIASLQA